MLSLLSTNAGGLPRENTPEMATASTEGHSLGERPSSDLRITVPSTYYPFNTVPVTPLYTLPAPNTWNMAITRESSYEYASSSVLSLTSLDVTPSPNSDSNAMASPIANHFVSMAATPEDTYDIATINTSPSNNYPATEPRTSITITDAPKVPEANICASSGSSWLTDLGRNTETDCVFRNTLFGAIPSLDNQNSPVSSLNSILASSASSFPLALLPSMSISLTSTPISSPSASSSLHCTSSMFPVIPERLTLLSTSTAAFPSSIDIFCPWREDVAVQMKRRETASQTRYVNHIGSSADHAEYHGSNQGETNPRTTGSKHFLQKAKKIGGLVRRFVTRSKRSEPYGAMEADSNFELNTPPGRNNTGTVEISAQPSPYGMRPSMSILHSPEQLRRSTSMSMFSLHPHWVREHAYEGVEGATEVPHPMPPEDATGFPCPEDF